MMYGITTDEDIPEACRVDQNAWDNLISDIWRSILEPHSKNAELAVEIAPGMSIKVAAALSKVKFTGTVCLVDVSRKALASVERKYGQCLPQAKLVCMPENLESCLHKIPKRPDLLLLSHVIDDMLMFRGTAKIPHLKKEKVFSWCMHNDTYELATTDNYEQAWHELMHRPSDLEQAKIDVLEQLIALVETVQPKTMIVSQYPSATLEENGMSSLNEHTDDVFVRWREKLAPCLKSTTYIQDILDQNKNYNHPHIGNNILNGANWLIYEDDRP